VIRTPSRRHETGTALVEVVWLVLLLLVPLVYVVVAVFDVQRASYAVSGAARAAARAYTLAPDEGSAPARARSAAAVALRDQDIEIADVALLISCRPVPDNCLSPGSSVTVEITHQVRLPLAPSALGGSAPSFRVQTSSTVAYGTYREDR
jgi:Flp pilus assembly protein TadG